MSVGGGRPYDFSFLMSSFPSPSYGSILPPFQAYAITSPPPPLLIPLLPLLGLLLILPLLLKVIQVLNPSPPPGKPCYCYDYYNR